MIEFGNQIDEQIPMLEGKGRKLVDLLKDPSKVKSTAFNDAGETTSESGDLSRYGYTVERTEANYGYVADVLNRMPRISVGDMTKGNAVACTHDRETTMGGQNYPPTNAEFSNVYFTGSPSGGLILANDNYGPGYQISKGKAPAFKQGSLMVPLRQWSDVAFLSWKSVTESQERHGLRFVLRRVIKNDRTVDVLKYIAKHEGFLNGRVLHGQALDVGPNTKGWLALLATPNVSGVFWLLVQHQADLGPKTIKGIRVFNEFRKGTYAPSLMIEVGDRVVDEGTPVDLSNSVMPKL